VLGVVRNLDALAHSDVLPRGWLAADYLELRARRAVQRPPRLARFLGHRVGYRDFDALIGLYEEVYLRRHYPFRPKRPDPLVIDCGANIGVATLYVKAIAPDARVVAFEPDPDAYRILTDNVARNRLGGVQCVPVAVAAREGRERLRVPAAALDGGATLRLAEGAGWTEVEVSTAPLSPWLTEPVDFLKLDIEGAELEVLEEIAAAGALDLVAEIAVEHHPIAPDSLARVLTLLAEWNYRCELAQAADRFWDSQQLHLIHAVRRSPS
jgi:FkbM family methyltransferase